MSIARGDHHVHSTYSDDAVSTVAENLAAAVSAGLDTVRFIDHVRDTTPWVPDFLAEVAALAVPAGLTVLTGVETKLMDTAGRLDLPPGLIVGAGGLDAIVIADHQFPGPEGPWSPSATIERLREGLAAEPALDQLVDAYVNAMEAHPASQLAHPFSILPKVGLAEDDLGEAQLARWAQAVAATGALVEVNEKWACPGPRVLRAVIDAGGTVVAATDSHDARDVGSYTRVLALMGEVGLA